MTKLTKRLIDSIPFTTTGQKFIRDKTLPGFALRITSKTKSFVFERRRETRLFRITIGRYGHLTVDQARSEAQKLAGDLARGKDPALEKRTRIQEATFGELESEYLERHGSQKKSVQNDVGALNLHLAHWRSRKLSAITRNDVARLHSAMGKAGHPYQANRTVALIRKMYNLARDWGMHDKDNPAERIQMFKETKRDRFLQEDELKKILKSLSKEPNPYIQTAFLVSLLTGARRNEVLTMQWEYIDFKKSLWRIPETKAGHPHLLPLPSRVCKMLQALPKIPDNPHVFVGRYGRGHLQNITRAWGRIRQHTNLHDVRIHDLRRTLGSWLAIQGASLPLIGKTLNHSQPSTTQIYARLTLDPVRIALEANAERMIPTKIFSEEK